MARARGCARRARTAPAKKTLTPPHPTLPPHPQSLYELDSGSIINALCFSPNRYWLCAATNKSIVIWDLESKAEVSNIPYPKLEEIGEKALKPFCTSLVWSADGNTLFSGWTDNVIRVFAVSSQ